MQKFLASVFFGAVFMSFTAAAYALEKGNPHTLTRQAWCDDKLKYCVSTIADSCKGKGISCTASETALCQGAFGAGSNCLNRPRLTGSGISPVPVKPKVKY